MGTQTWLTVAGGAVTLLAAVTTLAVTVGRPLRTLARQGDEFREDWYGEPARPGRVAVPGVPERLARIEAELRPNGGASLRDAVGRVEQRLEEHVRTHERTV